MISKEAPTTMPKSSNEEGAIFQATKDQTSMTSLIRKKNMSWNIALHTLYSRCSFLLVAKAKFPLQITP